METEAIFACTGEKAITPRKRIGKIGGKFREDHAA
jgi:hypothetical protein